MNDATSAGNAQLFLSLRIDAQDLVTVAARDTRFLKGFLDAEADTSV